MKIVLRGLTWMCALALGVVGTGRALAKPDNGAHVAACIAPQQQEVLNQCAGVAGGVVATQGRAPKSRLQMAARKPDAPQAKKRGPSIELDMATRRNRDRVQTKAWALLEKEVTVAKRLVSNTSMKDPRRPQILLRLAETYFEMQTQVNAKVRSYDEAIFQAQRAKDAAKVKKLQADQKAAEQQVNVYRKEAIRTYAVLVQDHPNFERMDEVLFSLAFGLDEMREFDRSRQVYHRLIKNYPQSKFIPHAYLSFAEYYFAEGDMKAAMQFYRRVTEFPPEKNSVYGYALYKQAWAEYNLENFKDALERFASVIEFAKQYPDARDSVNLAKQSRRELVLPYAQVGTPAKALEFFSRLAEGKTQALDMFENLGELYYDTGKWPQTITVYHRLMAESPQGEKLCYWQSRVANAVISSKPKAEQLVEVQRLVDVGELFQTRKHSGASKLQCRQQTATVIVELATAWHREAAGTEQQPGTNDKNTMRLSSQMYRLAMDKFPDLDQLEFPDLDKRDWPTRYRLSYYAAELLWKQENWGECAPAFDRVVELNPKGEYTTDAAYAAVLCYNNLYQQQYQSRERQVRKSSKKQNEKAEVETYAPRAFSPLEKGMLNAFNRYICYVKSGPDLATVKYRRARIYYEANHFEEAAVMFRDIAWHHKDSELGEFAANLYLDCLNVLGTMRKPAKPACIDEMTIAVQQIGQNYCPDAQAAEKYQDLCPTIGSVECGLLRKKAEAHQTNKEYRDAASTYIRIFRRYAKSSGECSARMDEVLYNAALNFEAARLLGRAIKVRTVLIEKFPESPLAKRAGYLVGANYHALAIYSKAAEYYEEFARKYPGELGKDCSESDRKAGTCTIASEALENAVFFRLGLGEEDKALEDARLYNANYKTRLPRETAQVAFSLGALYDGRKDWKKVLEYYTEFLKKHQRQALPHQVIRANVQIGKAYWESRDRPKSERYFATAIKEWKSGAPQKINKMSADPGKKALFLYEAKSAASEALFYMAELQYTAFQKIKFPEYKEGRNLDAVNRWAKTRFAKWVSEKQKALKTAEGAYNKIAELEVPEWMIASAARVGEMYSSFIDAFRDAPVPKEIEADEELYGIYVDELEKQAKTFEKPAVDKFEFCLVTATKVRWFNQWSRTCERELNRLNPTEYPMASELRGSPGYVQSALARPDAMVDVGGEDDEVAGAAQN